MVISVPWFAGEIPRTVAYAVFPLPRVSETGLPMRPFLGVEAALVSSKSEDREGARRLARFLSVGEAAVLRAVVGGQVPADVAAYDDPKVRRDPIVSAFRAAAKNAVAMPNTLEMARVWEPMKLALQAALKGGALPAQAGALADRRYRALIGPTPAPPVPYVLLARRRRRRPSGWAPARALSFAKRYPTRRILHRPGRGGLIVSCRPGLPSAASFPLR